MRSGQWGGGAYRAAAGRTVQKCQGVGNGAIGGGLRYLRERCAAGNERERGAVDGKLREVVKLAVPVTLADHEKFQDKFLNNLSFPERS